VPKFREAGTSARGISQTQLQPAALLENKPVPMLAAQSPSRRS
jgi:hypothetical protein